MRPWRAILFPAVAPAILALVWVATVSAAEFKVIHSFQGGSDGNLPAGNLVLDGLGNLYGGTLYGGGSQNCGYGCGTVFQLSNQNGRWTESVIHAFDQTDGEGPAGGLIFDAAGNIYGTSSFGGAHQCSYGCGNAFKLTRSPAGGWAFSSIYEFCSLDSCVDGYDPTPGLIFDKNGNLYGTTPLGGKKGIYGYGVIFQLTPDGEMWNETDLYDFCVQDTCTNGAAPTALVSDGKGNFYGTTVESGKNKFPCFDSRGCGGIFELARQKGGLWAFKFIHLFNGKDGAGPLGLVSDNRGTLYGVTRGGGGLGKGTAFQLVKKPDGTWKSVVLYNFRYSPSYSAPVFDAAGNLLGTTTRGGIGSCFGGPGCGMVYKLEPQPRGPWKFHSLYKFSGHEDGGTPSGGLTLDGSGNLYGVTQIGGAQGLGVVYEVTP